MIILNNVVSYLKILAIPLGVIIFSPLILAFFNIVGVKTYSLVILIIMSITAFISGFLVGRRAKQKGYINGIIFGAVLVFLLFIFSLFGENNYSIHSFIYYLIIILSSTVGSMFGIQKKISE